MKGGGDMARAGAAVREAAHWPVPDRDLRTDELVFPGMKHAEIEAGLFITRPQATRADLPSRGVVVDDVAYFIQLKPGTARSDGRFDARFYAVVELPGEWNAVVQAPERVTHVDHFWYRELVELVERARLFVNMRRST